MGMAASALYISSVRMGEIHSQREIAQAAGVTEVTLRNRCKDLKKTSMILYHHVTLRRQITFEELKENLNYFLRLFRITLLSTLEKLT